MSRDETSSRRPAVSPALARLKQYQGYIKKVTAGETGRLTPGRGETPAAVRRRARRIRVKQTPGKPGRHNTVTLAPRP